MEASKQAHTYMCTYMHTCARRCTSNICKWSLNNPILYRTVSWPIHEANWTGCLRHQGGVGRAHISVHLLAPAASRWTLLLLFYFLDWKRKKEAERKRKCGGWGELENGEQEKQRLAHHWLRRVHLSCFLQGQEILGGPWALPRITVQAENHAASGMTLMMLLVFNVKRWCHHLV